MAYTQDPTETDTSNFVQNTLNGPSTSQLQGDYQAGSDSAKGLLNQGNSFNNGLSYGDSAMTSAIRSKYDQQYGMSEQKQKLQNLQMAQTDHLQKLQVATNLANQEVQMNLQKQLLKEKQRQAGNAARGQLLGSILGIAGAAGGAAYGGPSGAIAGGGLGQGIGSAVGSA